MCRTTTHGHGVERLRTGDGRDGQHRSGVRWEGRRRAVRRSGHVVGWLLRARGRKTVPCSVAPFSALRRSAFRRRVSVLLRPGRMLLRLNAHYPTCLPTYELSLRTRSLAHVHDRGAPGCSTGSWRADLGPRGLVDERPLTLLLIGSQGCLRANSLRRHRSSLHIPRLPQRDPTDCPSLDCLGLQT